MSDPINQMSIYLLSLLKSKYNYDKFGQLDEWGSDQLGD